MGAHDTDTEVKLLTLNYATIVQTRRMHGDLGEPHSHCRGVLSYQGYVDNTPAKKYNAQYLASTLGACNSRTGTEKDDVTDLEY